MKEVISLVPFAKIDLKDAFFDSLRDDYNGFDEWFRRKGDQGEKAYVQYRDNAIQAFLYLKDENGVELVDVKPSRPACKRLKVGTFKIDAHNTKLGERFIKRIMDVAVLGAFEEVYVTIFPKHDSLVKLLQRYGFEEEGKKEGEMVLVKNMRKTGGDILKDFPLLQTKGKRKFLLSIYPKFHTRLFPDSILNNEENKKETLIQDVSYTNSIHKIYLCFMPDTMDLNYGDIIVIYRTTDGLGPAHYRSVITSVCQVEEVRPKRSFVDVKDFVRYTNYYSVFDEKDLLHWYHYKDVIVIKMLYNAALAKRVTRGYLLDDVGLSPDQYWGFFRLTDEQFSAIIKKGEINENLIVD